MPTKQSVFVYALAFFAVALPVIAEPHGQRAGAIRHGNAKRMTRQRRQAVGVGASILGFASSDAVPAPAAATPTTTVNLNVTSTAASATGRAQISDDGLSTLDVATLTITGSEGASSASSRRSSTGTQRASNSSSAREASKTEKATKTSSASAERSTATSSAKDIAPGTISTEQGCKKYQTIKVGDTCEKIVEALKIDSLETFYSWNKGLNEACTNLLAGSDYCVEGPSDSAAKATSSSAAKRPAASSSAPSVASSVSNSTESATATTIAVFSASATGVNAQIIGFATSLPVPAAAAAAAATPASSPAPVAVAQQAPGVNAQVLGFGDGLPAAPSTPEAAKKDDAVGGYNYRRWQ